MNKKIVIMMSGVSGSFKSTIASLIRDGWEGSEIVSADNFPGYYTSGGYHWTSELCKIAHHYCRNSYSYYIELGVSLIIVDNTNLSKSQRHFYKNEAEKHGYEYVVLAVLPQMDQLEKYASRNKHGVKLGHIKEMANTFYKDLKGEGDVKQEGN